jgi:hypothetical protein
MWAQFDQLDKDKDGRLDVNEFKAGCAVPSPGNEYVIPILQFAPDSGFILIIRSR